MTFDILKRISPRPELIAIMELRYDIHNLKVFFKAKFLGVKSDLIIPAGTMKQADLEYAINEDDFRDLPDKIRSAAESINEDFLVNRDPQVIDLAFDRVLYEQLLLQAGAGGSSLILGMFTRQIDLINLKSLIRIKRMGLDREFLKKVLLPQGLIPLDRLYSVIDEPLESLIPALAMSEYAELVADGVRDWLEKGSASRLEKLADDYITTYLRQGKWAAFGIEPLIGYLWAREIEIKNIRLIMVGLINKLPAEAIRGRIRNAYI